MKFFYVLICYLTQIKSEINTFTSFYNLLTNEDIKKETLKSISLAVKDNASFLVDENGFKEDIFIFFVQIHKNFLEVKVRDFHNAITKKIVEFENLVWERKSFCTSSCNQIFNLLFSEYPEIYNLKNGTIILDIFADEVLDSEDVDRLQKETAFLKQFNTRLGFLKNTRVIDNHLRSYIENEKNFFSLEKRGIKHFYPTPNVDEIIRKLIYRDDEFSGSKKHDVLLEDSLIPYLLKRIRNDTNYFVSFLECVLKSEYNSASFNLVVIRELLKTKSFVNVSDNIFNSLDKKLLTSLKIKDKNSLSKLINDENVILKMRNSSEHDKLFKNMVYFLFKTYRECFMKKMKFILQEKTFENHLHFFLFDILSFLRQKIDYYIFFNDGTQFLIQKYDFQNPIQDCKIFNEISKKIKAGEGVKYSEAMIDLIKYD